MNEALSETQTTPLTRVVLASASPRRSELLRGLGLDVAVVPSGYAEPAIVGASPAALSLIHAIEKARDVAARFPDDVVIAADTVVEIDGDALGKPVDVAHARAMLTRLSGRDHIVRTSFAVLSRGRLIARTCSTEVRMATLDAERIAAYVASGEPLDKAGSYGIQGRGACNVESIRGDYFTVVGLPLFALNRAFEELGFTLFSV